jgi:hypothetical protein
MHRLAAVALAALGCAPRLPAADVSFTNDVMAVLSRAGCNSGACHGNLNGKGGFKLSLRGQEPADDLRTLTRDQFARRVDPANPGQSLLLQKAAGQVPHEGGTRFLPTSPEYAAVRAWVAAGCRPDPAETPRVVGLDVTPLREIAVAPADRVKLSAIARFSDGSRRDVTGLATYELNNVGVVKVLPTGEAVKEMDGEAVVLVRYLDKQVPVRLAFLPDRPAPDYSKLPTRHPIDKLVLAQLKEVRLAPADLCSDEVFVRRAYLDACGMIPSADEARRFLADRSPDKRDRLVDELLARPEFAEYWAQKWSDLLRNEEKALDRKGVQVYYRWIKGWIADDKPLTEFAAAVLAARGNTYENPPANFYRAVRDPYQRAESAAQVFLGLRISCAKCHNHPFDVWTQDDYHRFVALFARIDYRVGENGKKDNLDKHEFVGEQSVLVKHDGELPHPRGGDAAPKFLGAKTPGLSGDADRTAAVAAWVADPKNPFFAKAQANRVWLHLMGRGLVDPVDDFRASNPASNPPLMDHLAKAFVEGGYRIKPLVRHVMRSRTYQLASVADGPTGADETHFARALVQPLEAEQLLDALASVFGVPVAFPGYPAGLRAGQLPAPVQAGRRQTATTGSRFLKVFGKPDRLTTCECERSDEPGMIQAFQMLTGELLTGMLREPDNRIGKLLAAKADDGVVLDELYLAAISRRPSAAERAKLLGYVGAATDRRAAWEDVAWGLVNAKEFLLRR